MMVRMFKWTAKDVYEFYNMRHLDWPDLPPPPNPTGLQAFMMACLEATIAQITKENGGDEASGKRHRQRTGN